MGFRPQPPGVNVESTLIWYKGSNEKNFKYWVDTLESFLEGEFSCDFSPPPIPADGFNENTLFSSQKISFLDLSFFSF